MIKKVGKQKYTVIANSGRKMGTYSSKKQAQKRLAQVEMFKSIAEQKKKKK